MGDGRTGVSAARSGYSRAPIPGLPAAGVESSACAAWNRRAACGAGGGPGPKHDDAGYGIYRPVESEAYAMNKERVAQLIRELLIEIGEDPEREGLRKTPERVARAYEFLTSGYRGDIKKVINDAVFMSHANNMIICRDIEVYSLCEHHMLPFFGKCHIGYIAHDKVVGLSKLARIVDFYARRLQIQERLTQQIARQVMDTTRSEVMPGKSPLSSTEYESS